MLKHIIVLLAVSVLVVLFPAQAQIGLNYLITAHDWISELLTNVFTEGQAGNIARGLIALLSIPLLVGLVPSLIYWMVRRHWFPFFMEIVWVVWLVQVGALMMVYKVAG